MRRCLHIWVCVFVLERIMCSGMAELSRKQTLESRDSASALIALYARSFLFFNRTEILKLFFLLILMYLNPKITSFAQKSRVFDFWQCKMHIGLEVLLIISRMRFFVFLHGYNRTIIMPSVMTQLICLVWKVLVLSNFLNVTFWKMGISLKNSRNFCFSS